MRRSVLPTFWTVGLAILTFSPLSPAAEEPSWKAGTARARITPEKPLWMAGYAARTQPADGTLHDLWVKALSLEDSAGHRVVLVTLDLIGLPANMYDKICGQLESRCGLQRRQVMLNASHTHSGPVMRQALWDIYPLDDRQRAMIEEYSSFVEDTIVATVMESLSSPTAVVLSASEGKATFGANRRENSEADAVAARARGESPKGVSDSSVPVLAVRTPQGALKAVVFGYACHSTTLSIQQWNGDYAGFTQIDLERAHPDAQMMFFAGCGADQNPMPRRTVELCRRHGRELAEAVERVIADPMRPIPAELGSAFEFITLDFGPTPTQAELEKTATRENYQGRWATRLLGRMAAGESLETSYRYPVQVWKLGGEQLWISLGGEVTVDYALRFKAQYGPTTWTAGYSNDVMAYIPSQRVWEEGGYEAGAFSVYGLPAAGWATGVEQRISDSVARLVQRLEDE